MQGAIAFIKRAHRTRNGIDGPLQMGTGRPHVEQSRVLAIGQTVRTGHVAHDQAAVASFDLLDAALRLAVGQGDLRGDLRNEAVRHPRLVLRERQILETGIIIHCQSRSFRGCHASGDCRLAGGIFIPKSSVDFSHHSNRTSVDFSHRHAWTLGRFGG